MLIRKTPPTNFSWFDFLLSNEISKACMIVNKSVGRVEGVNWVWNWELMACICLETRQLQLHVQLLHDFKTAQGEDKCIWEGDDDGTFTIRSLRHCAGGHQSSSWVPHFHWVPQKIRCFVWKTRLNQTPSKEVSQFRGLIWSRWNVLWALLSENDPSY